MKSDVCGGGGRGERVKEERDHLKEKKPYNEKLIFTQLKLEQPDAIIRGSEAREAGQGQIMVSILRIDKFK